METERSLEPDILADSKCPWFPSSLVVENVLPFLDRATYENIICLNKEIHQSVKESPILLPPWPEKVLLKHSSRVTCVAFSSSSRAVACGCDDGSVFLWKRRNGERMRLERDNSNAFASVAALSIVFSSDEKYLAMGSVDTSIYLWKLGEDFCSNILASAGHDTFVNLWNVSTPSHLGTVNHPEKVESIAVSPDGESLASSTWDGTVRVFAIDNGADRAEAIAALMSKNPTVKVLGKGLPLTNVQWSKDGAFVYGLKGFRLRRWQIDSVSDSTCFSGHRINRIHSIALSPTGHRVAYSEGDGTIRVSTLASAYYKAVITRILSGHSQDCTMAFSPDGRCLASGSGDGTLKLWNVA
ncbi:myosin heavy-chain kinase [Nitzschia inconspicua]|uniref:Myosin heavy-chain kinase n=1 Tax=Nitzschia inconspicua TaxID=303405 RepID=A0A9K3K408_9STRA|nr:myosin heavy-chain kinase [Nitzschia inconspicua]